MIMYSLPTRFWDKVKTSDTHFYEGTPCWEWIAYTDKEGYGRFQLNGKSELAHRLSYEEKYGTIPKGLQINHKCRNRACQNRDDHLETITQQENMRIGLSGFKRSLQQRLKTHCPQRHEYNEENTHIFKGKRYCRTCNRIKCTQYRHRKKLKEMMK